jgi:menaquinol-cytochrome c reductase iron-sulfur subunit
MHRLTRRQMIAATGAASAVIGLMLTVPAIGFVLNPLVQRTRRAWVEVGSIDDVPVAKPTPFVVGVPTGEAFDTTPVQRVVYVVKHQDGSIKALTNVCSHMQCDVHWDDSLGQFLCPCHGGLYDMDGVNIDGPPPSPMPQWVHRLHTDAAGRTVLEIENDYDESI